MAETANLIGEGRPKDFLPALSFCPRKDVDPRTSGKEAIARCDCERAMGRAQGLLRSIIGSMTATLHEESGGAAYSNARDCQTSIVQTHVKGLEILGLSSGVWGGMHGPCHFEQAANLWSSMN